MGIFHHSVGCSRSSWAHSGVPHVNESRCLLLSLDCTRPVIGQTNDPAREFSVLGWGDYRNQYVSPLPIQTMSLVDKPFLSDTTVTKPICIFCITEFFCIICCSCSASRLRLAFSKKKKNECIRLSWCSRVLICA